ncbi:MAG: mannose-6-phosphate isomerase, class I [Bacteroidota bacterium]
MSYSPKVLPLEGVIQTYAWGGDSFLSDLTGKPQPREETWAEWWLGAHPKGPAETAMGTLDKLISDRPAEVLSKKIAAQYENKLPFLLKVLDVQDTLSIQVHPTIAMAKAGYAREEAAGLDRMAANRNYRDQNHKPELAIALTDFYLLHGFKSLDRIAETLKNEPAWAPLLTTLSDQGLTALYDRVMSASEEQIKAWLSALRQRLAKAENLSKSEPDYWAKRAFERYGADRGIFSIYWLNLVSLKPGEGIFQAARVPHAYLSGACVELMANSDNVLRGGLTPKHVDPPELMKALEFSETTPKILSGTALDSGWKVFETPAPDFKLFSAKGSRVAALPFPAGPAIMVVYEGRAIVKNSAVKQKENKGSVFLEGQDFRRGQACWLPHNHGAELHLSNDAIVYLATVG